MVNDVFSVVWARKRGGERFLVALEGPVPAGEFCLGFAVVEEVLRTTTSYGRAVWWVNRYRREEAGLRQRP